MENLSDQARGSIDEMARPGVLPTFARRPRTGRSEGSSWNEDRVLTGLLWSAVVLGGVLRMAGLSFRLPAVHHPDEEAILHQALRFGTSVMHGQLSGKITLFGLTLLALCMIFFVGLRLTGRVGSLAGFESYFLEHASPFLLMGRAISVAASVGTIWATYRLGRELVDRRLGVIAATLVAVSPVAVTEAHFLKLDSSVVFLTVLALSELVRQTRAPTRGGWLRVGLLVGLASATHVNGLILLPLPIVVYALQSRTDPQRLQGPRLMALYATALACFGFLTFRLANVFARHEAGTAEKYHLEALVTNLTGESHLLGRIGHSVEAYTRFYLPRFLGVAALIGAVAGLVLLARSGELRPRLRLFAPLLVFGAIYLASLLPFSFRAERYALPVLAVEAVLAALVIRQAITAIPGRARNAVWIGLFVLFAAPPAYASLRAAYEFSGVPDTRDLARAWIEGHVPDDAKIAIEAFNRLPTMTLQLEQGREEVQYKLDRTIALNAGTGKVLRMKLSRSPYPVPSYQIVDLTGEEPVFPTYENAYDLEQLRRQGVQYVVLSSEIESLYDPPAQRVAKAQVITDIVEMPATSKVSRLRTDFAANLRRLGSLVASFGPARSWHLRGPVLSVFSLDRQ